MESEEDPNSLLSLPHTLLQADSGSSANVQTTEKPQQWLEGSNSEGTSSGIHGHFSMISPSLTYSLTAGSSSQLLTNSSKYYGSGINASVGPSHHNISSLMTYSRPDHRSLANNFSSSRSSVGHSSSTTGNAFDFNMSAVSYNENDLNEYYQTSSYRNNMNLYNNRSLTSGNDSFEHSSHHFDTPQTANSSILNHTNYEHESTELDESVDMPKPQSRHQHLQNHQNPGDIMEFSEIHYSKDLGDIYNMSSTKTNATFTHEGTTAMDKRQLEMNNLDLDFSLGARDFDPVSSSSNSRTDYASLHRSADLDYRLDQDQATNYLSQDLTTQKYSSSQSFDTSINSVRKMPTTHSEFTASQKNINQNLYPGSKKALNEHPEVTFVHKEQMAGGRSSDHHRFLTESKKAQDSFLKEDHESLATNPNPSKLEEKWSGRSRAHRKMARLLGQGLGKEKLEKPQDESVNQMFSKKTQNLISKKPQNLLIEYSSSQDANKSLEASRKYSYHEMSFRDSPSNARPVKNIERKVNSTEKLTTQCDRRGEVSNRNQNFARDYNSSTTVNMPSTSVSLNSMSREVSSSLLPNQHLVSSTPALDLEFQQSLAQRELDLNPQFVLQVSKDLGMEENLTESVNQVELFSHHIDQHQLAPPNFTFPDNLNSQCPQEINLDSYLIPSDKENSFSKKFPYHNQRNLSTETDFNIEEYMEGQVDKDLTQAYFDRTDVPQDMTMYQKSSPDKSTANHSSSKLKERESVHSGKIGNKQNESICELQRELTKSSGKESMKGVRIPRDINRAMEILQDLQETEKEEERRKKELERQQQNELQEAQQHQQQQQQQQQQQKYQPTSSVNSSPKKTFQNKHQIESMALTEQQLLGMPANFIEDQSVENVNFLDQSPYCFPDQSSATAGFCDPSLQEMSQYSGFSSLYQASDVDVAALSSKSRDYQQNTGYQLNQELDYHILKRLALSAANSKDIEANMSSLQTASNAWPAGNSSQTEAELHFNLGMSRLPEHLGLLNEGLSTKFTSASNTVENRGQYHNESYADINSEQRPLEPDKLQNFSSFGDGVLTSMAPTVLDKTSMTDIVETSRQNLYMMMKQEHLCDAIISTSKVEVKVHQTILCSMSQYLSKMLLPSNPSSSASESKAVSMTTLSFPPSSKFKDTTHPRSRRHHHHLVMLVINCDSIKSSSISAFLMFIYLGKTEFSESNIMDLFILASSLHVLPLKNLCLEFMWQAHIPEDQVKIPQLQISNMGLETRDQACSANMGTKKSMEDKGIGVGRSPHSMDVASQTDRTTCKVGGGGQEEWVMLKKTKQKTVSPSKSKTGFGFKGLGVQDSQPVFKPGKKPWLSPKRRFKSELLAQTKYDPNNLTKLKDKDTGDSLDVRKYGNEMEDGTRELNQMSNRFSPPQRHVTVTKRPQMIPERNATKRSQEENEDKLDNADMTVRHVKTTVEIAEEAAAAKMSAHAYNSYQSRKGLRKCSMPIVSSENPYDIQERTMNLQNKINSLLKNRSMTSSSQSSGEIQNTKSESSNLNKELTIFDSDSNVAKQIHITKGVEITRKGSHDNSNTSLSMRPVRKKFSHQVLIPEASGSQSLNVIPKTTEHITKSVSFSDEKIVSDTNVFISSPVENTADFPAINEGDLSHVSHFLDSIVNKMGSETEDAELQKVIHDLDSELYRPQITTPVSSNSFFPASSSFSSSSLSSSSMAVTSVSTSSLSSSPVTSTATSSVVKSKSAAQGFRKRLIQLVKSENLKLSSSAPNIEGNSLNEKGKAKEVSSNIRTDEMGRVDAKSDSSTLVPNEKIKNDDNVELSSAEPSTERRENTPTSHKINTPSSHKINTPSSHKTNTPSSHKKNILSLHPNLHQENTPNLHQENTPNLHQENTPNLHQENTPNLHQENTPNLHQESTPSLHQENIPGLHQENAMNLLQENTPGLHQENIQSFHQQNKGSVEEGTNPTCEKGKDAAAATEDYDTQFHHKIFKRKRKSKPRKVVNEADGVTGSKVKVKKCVGVELETSGMKTRPRRITTSDTEAGGARSKTKKVGPNELEGSLIRNVRPPPKKRAKMELEMLKVADGDTAKDGQSECDKGVQTQEEQNLRVDEKNSRVGPGSKNTAGDGLKQNEVEADGTKRSEENVKVRETGVKETVKALMPAKSKSLTSKKKNGNSTKLVFKAKSDTNEIPTPSHGTQLVFKAKSNTNEIPTPSPGTKLVFKAKSDTSEIPTPSPGTQLVFKAKSDTTEIPSPGAKLVVKAKSDTDEISTHSPGTKLVIRAKSDTNEIPTPSPGTKLVFKAKSDTNEIPTPSPGTKLVVKAKSDTNEIPTPSPGTKLVIKANSDTTEIPTPSPGTKLVIKAKSDTNEISTHSPGTKLVIKAKSDTNETPTPSRKSTDPSEAQYASHLQKQFAKSGLKTRVFSCKLCKSHLKSALISVKHVKVIHKLQGDEILHNIMVGYAENGHEACDICGYVTKDQTYKYMHYHKYFKHNVPLPPGLVIHKCHLCPREFQTSYQLNEHVKGHAEDFSFTCWYCGQSFKSRNNMNNHVFHKHSKLRSHMCKICDKAFKTWTQLKVHVRIHTGDRPFSCTECNYGSTTLGNMRHHLFHKHRKGKDEVEEAMVKISERKPEMTPAGLDELMNLVLLQSIPDRARRLTEVKGKNNEVKLKKQKGKETDKSPTENSVKADTSPTENCMKKKEKMRKYLSPYFPTLALKEFGDTNGRVLPVLKPTNVLPAVNTSSGLNLSWPDISSLSGSQPKAVTVISQPVMANNIVIFPCTGPQTSKPESATPTLLSQSNQPLAIVSTQGEQNGDGSHISSEGNSVHSGCHGMVNSAVSKNDLQTNVLVPNPVLVNGGHNIPNTSVVQTIKQPIFTSPNSGNDFTLNAHHPVPNHSILMPLPTVPHNKTHPEFEMTSVSMSNILPNQLGQCGSSIVYANQPIMVQNPVMAGGPMYHGMPSFIMYSCPPNQSVIQIQGVPDLHIVPTTGTSGMMPLSVEVPALYPACPSTVTAISTQSNGSTDIPTQTTSKK